MVTLFLLGFFTSFMYNNAEIHNECNSINIKTNFVYEDLKCVPTFDDTTSCLKEYDCSHINNKPPGKCLLRGKLYKPGEEPDEASGVEGRCDHAFCTCSEIGDFECAIPSDSCAEFWVPNFVKPGCYLGYELNQCCTSGQICPPFDNNAKCEVNGVVYEEGKRFEHPSFKCIQCICQKGFQGQFLPPFCQRSNCTTELLYSKSIRDYCAPFYTSLDNCCPISWVCPVKDEIYIPAFSEPPLEPQCRFGNRKMRLGEKIEQPATAHTKPVFCECITPPYLTCTYKINKTT
ncbi:hypothetical protein ILUMI_02101 [Ignelater luminosus]|uniref:VWFC domain-containing protein n=1 Tax=Ignelater luminosus TaxID=2038154 RepID=A0A8K0DH59_IGNLU|nr:hypothetical protein ILUMI_02101 [Ignelater luminosus]